MPTFLKKAIKTFDPYSQDLIYRGLILNSLLDDDEDTFILMMNMLVLYYHSAGNPFNTFASHMFGLINSYILNFACLL